MVVPTYDPRQLPKSLRDLRGSFPHRQDEHAHEQEGDETMTEEGGMKVHVTVIILF